MDPAISKVFELLEKHVGPNYPKKHCALLPRSSGDLATHLSRFNIEVLYYDAPSDLWTCFESLPLKLVSAKKAASPPVAEPFPLPVESMRKFLASCYVQWKVSPVAEPVRESVLHGIVLSLIEKAGREGQAIGELAVQLRRMIPMTPAEANLTTSRAVDSLIRKGWAGLADQRIVLARSTKKPLEDNLALLVRGVLNRLFLREGVDPKPSYAVAVQNVLEEVFLTRGWDLGAQFVGAKTSGAADIYEAIRKSVRQNLPTETFERHDRLANSIYDLLKRPDDLEAQVLADFARLSFGLTVLLKAGTSALKAESLPERIYFDASILMPAITDGHPIRPIYQNTIEKLVHTVRETGSSCELLVASDFLNEIVSHRNLAQSLVRELGLDDPSRLEKHILYYGAENTNVFVGAYASWVGRQKEAISFNEFLEKAAPYADESDLAAFVEGMGIRPIKVAEVDRQFLHLGNQYIAQLTQAYSALSDAGWVHQKLPVLIKHEARQLAQIELELRAGRKSLFVTADRGLRETLGNLRLGAVWNVVISHLGLVQLVDLLLGVEAEPRSLARVLWGIMEYNEHAAMRDYFIDLALKRQDEALAMTLPQIIEEFVGEAQKSAKLEGIRFFTRNVEDKAKAARFLDRFELQFFEKLAEAVRHRKLQA